MENACGSSIKVKSTIEGSHFCAGDCVELADKEKKMCKQNQSCHAKLRKLLPYLAEKVMFYILCSAWYGNKKKKLNKN